MIHPLTMTHTAISEILFRQGFGTRRSCEALALAGRVRIEGAEVDDPLALFETQGLQFEVDGVAWSYQDPAYLMLNKPAGTECSQRPKSWPSVYELLPAPLRQRPRRGGTDGVQAVGRLDQDTTGLLLLSDDGQFLHRMASPRHHVPKVYEVTPAQDIEDRQIGQLLEGVALEGEPQPVRALQARRLAGGRVELTLTEGKYHQVKRMLAAVGGHVAALHRRRIGALELPPDLPLGGWRWLSASELAACQERGLPG